MAAIGFQSISPAHAARGKKAATAATSPQPRQTRIHMLLLPRGDPAQRLGSHPGSLAPPGASMRAGQVRRLVRLALLPPQIGLLVQPAIRPDRERDGMPPEALRVAEDERGPVILEHLHPDQRDPVS